MIDKKDIKLGTKVTFDAEYIRMARYIYASQEREWSIVKTQLNNGIIVGTRTLQDGTLYFDGDDGNYFVSKKYKKCILVATNINRKFTRVPIENIYLESEKDNG